MTGRHIFLGSLALSFTLGCGDEAEPLLIGCAAPEGMVSVQGCQALVRGDDSCDPFGTWDLDYETKQSARSDIQTLRVSRNDEGVTVVGFGQTESATLSDDGCQLSATSLYEWSNVSEFGSQTHVLELTFEPEGAVGTVASSRSGFRAESGSASVVGQRRR